MTIKITAAGMTPSKHHLGVEAIAAASPGDVIAIDNHGDITNNCWGEILTCGAKMKGVSGVVIDGAARDVDICQEIDFPVFARAVVPITARSRTMQEDFNCMIRLGDVQVKPGDLLLGDESGVVAVPHETFESILAAALEIEQAEQAILEAVRKGLSLGEARKKFGYHDLQAKR